MPYNPKTLKARRTKAKAKRTSILEAIAGKKAPKGARNPRRGRIKTTKSSSAVSTSKKKSTSVSKEKAKKIQAGYKASRKKDTGQRGSPTAKQNISGWDKDRQAKNERKGTVMETASKRATQKQKVTGKGSKVVHTKKGARANVTREQLTKTGLSLKEYLNRWNRTGKRPS